MATTYKLVDYAATDPGDFSVAHGLGTTPVGAQILDQSGKPTWFQDPALDETDINLVAGTAGIKGKVMVWWKEPWTAQSG